MPKEFFVAYKTYMDYIGRPDYQNNPECVKDVINQLYWYSVSHSNTEEKFQVKYLILAIAIGVVFILTLVLFTIYFKRKNKSSEDLAENTDETQELEP